MNSATHASLWAMSGFGIWILVLALPLLVYFVIGAFQRNRPRKGPDLTLGERLDNPSEPVQREDRTDDREAG